MTAYLERAGWVDVADGVILRAVWVQRQRQQVEDRPKRRHGGYENTKIRTGAVGDWWFTPGFFGVQYLSDSP